MNIVDFDLCHVAGATCIAKNQLDDMRGRFDLPDATLPDLSGLAQGMGVAAMRDGRMLGYLVGFGPFRGMFGTWGTGHEDRFVGVFSPLQAHAVMADAPTRTWQRMYQAAAEKWAAVGAGYHALALYEGDAVGKRELFRYGFGQRCADAVRRVTPLQAETVPGVTVCELPAGSGEVVRSLREGLDIHLCQSPCFMLRNSKSREAWLNEVAHRQSRLFVAKADGRVIAFIEVAEEGENFLTMGEDILNICGAYCVPEWRGKGVSRLLLARVLEALGAEGVRWLGVDYETMNPTAVGFWEKYFTPYTASLVRRIDKI